MITAKQHSRGFRGKRTLVLGLALAAIFPFMSSRASSQAPEPLNILVIITDDQRRVTLKPFPGATYFPNFYATTPFCCPSRASIMTGQYAHNHGVVDNELEDPPVDLVAPTLQGYLQDAGYRTGVFGKLLNKWRVEYNPSNFDEWMLLAARTEGGGFYNARWNDQGTVVTRPEYSTNIAFNRADAFIRAQEGPWYASVAPFAPHSPYTPEAKYADTPVSYWGGNPATREQHKGDKPPFVRRSRHPLSEGQYIRRQQIRSLRTVYAGRDKLIASLKATGQYDNTIILFLSDNGYMWGEHGLTRKVRPYDPSIRVGAYLKGPGLSGGTDASITANIDVLPTLLNMAGVPYDGSIVDGRDMRTVSRSAILTEWSGILEGYPQWASIRTSNFQYIEWYRADGSIRFKEYYNMTSDPWQLHNLLHDGEPKNNPNRSALHTRLAKARACKGISC